MIDDYEYELMQRFARFHNWPATLEWKGDHVIATDVLTNADGEQWTEVTYIRTLKEFREWAGY